MHDLKTQEMTFTQTLGNRSGKHYIKVKEIAQNPKGDFYAVCYIDDGKFWLNTFTKSEKIDEVCFNEMLGLDDFTVPNESFNDPFLTCCFLNDTKIFVTLFYNFKQLHHHFIWDLNTREHEQLVVKQMECNSTNFPQKCFYNEDADEIYVFYRQGQCFTINARKLDCYRLEKISDRDLG